MIIKTDCWFAPLPENHVRIGISRATPRNMPKRSYKIARWQAPGDWFNRIPDPVRWAERYQREILERFQPLEVMEMLAEKAGDQVAVLCCFEQPPPDQR